MEPGSRTHPETKNPHFSNKKEPSPLSDHLAGLHHGLHVCSFHKSLDESLALASAWIKEGVDRGETGICVAGDRAYDDFVQAIAEAGVDAARERERGSILFVTKWDWRHEGVFDTRLMSEGVKKLVNQVLSRGARGLWIAVDMTWALEPNVALKGLVEWETMWNDLLTDIPVVLLCQYDEHRFTPEFMRPQLHTHPFFVHESRIYPNAFYDSSAVVKAVGR
jgi:hypothetical protein